MRGINAGRVVLGGLLAGVVIGIFSALFIPLFAASWQGAFDALGASPPDGSAAFLAGGTALTFSLGIVTVWLYAAIRPRYGAGAKTAAVAGLVVWLVVGITDLSLVLLTNLTLALVVATHGPNLLSLVAAAIAGGWVYREEAAPAGAPAAAPVHSGS